MKRPSGTHKQTNRERHSAFAVTSATIRVFLNLCEKCPLIDLVSGCKYGVFWVNFAVCLLFGTFGVSQAESDRPIKALENTSPLAFTQIEEDGIFGRAARSAVKARRSPSG
jgi:hypothetical protein